MGINLEKWCIYIYSWIKSVGFMLFLFQKTKEDLKAQVGKKAKHPAVVRRLETVSLDPWNPPFWCWGFNQWSCWWSFQKKIRNSEKSQVFRNRNWRCQLHQSSFVVDDLIWGEFWKIWPDSSGEISLTIPTWPRRRNLCTFLGGYLYVSLWYLLKKTQISSQWSIPGVSRFTYVYIARVIGLNA